MDIASVDCCVDSAAIRAFEADITDITRRTTRGHWELDHKGMDPSDYRQQLRIVVWRSLERFRNKSVSCPQQEKLYVRRALWNAVRTLQNRSKREFELMVQMKPLLEEDHYLPFGCLEARSTLQTLAKQPDGKKLIQWVLSGDARQAYPEESSASLNTLWARLRRIRIRLV